VVTTVIIASPLVVDTFRSPVSREQRWGTIRKDRNEEDSMTEQPKVPRQPASDEESPPAGPGDDSGQPGKVRTQGETAVDEAMGTGDNVH
jgi:hypothetical protein